MDPVSGSGGGDNRGVNGKSSIYLKPEARVGEDGYGDDVGAIQKEEMMTLIKSIKNLAVNPKNDSNKTALVSKLEVVRIQSAAEKRQVRKAAWIAETQKEVKKRQEFRKNGPEERVFPGQAGDSGRKSLLSNMCNQWRDSLKIGRTNFLFHKIFPVLHLNGQLSRDLVLNCRSVCREWNNSIQTWIQHSSIYPPTTLFSRNASSVSSAVDMLEVKLKVHDVSRIRELSRRSFPFRTINPFFSGKLRLDCSSPHDYQSNVRFWSTLEDILFRWSLEIQSLTVQFSNDRHFNSVSIYNVMWGLMKLMPNLRSLVISSPDPLKDSADLKEWMEEKPLPNMPNLGVLVTTFIPPRMLNAMLKKFGPCLMMIGANGVNVNQNVYGNTSLPKLKTYSVVSRELYSSESNFKVNWPSVEDIDLYYENAEGLGIQKLFQSLGEVAGSLRGLHITFQNVTGSKLDAGAMKKLSLELDQLEDFSLTVDRANLNTIDFILPMVSLKKLTVYYVKTMEHSEGQGKPKGSVRKGRGPQPKSSKSSKAKVVVVDHDHPSAGIIKFWNYMDRLYESNIWGLFPELKSVTIVVVTKLDGKQQKWGSKTETTTRKDYTRDGHNNE